MKLQTLLTAATALAVSTSLALAAPGGLELKNGYLVNASGMTLYSFDKDSSSASNCYSQCAVNWPPAVAAPGDKAEGKYTLVKRNDGSSQWAYNGQPLYLWINDNNPGDKTGDGVGGVWHIVKKYSKQMKSTSGSTY